MGDWVGGTAPKFNDESNSTGMDTGDVRSSEGGDKEGIEVGNDSRTGEGLKEAAGGLAGEDGSVIGSRMDDVLTSPGGVTGDELTGDLGLSLDTRDRLGTTERGGGELETASPLAVGNIMEPRKDAGRDKGILDVRDGVGTIISVDCIGDPIAVDTTIALDDERKSNGTRLELG